MLYHLHELRKAALRPTNLLSGTMDVWAKSLPEEMTAYGRVISATSEVVHRSTRVFGKPEFGLSHCVRNSETLDILEREVMVKPFCTLKQFQRLTNGIPQYPEDPRVLIVAPLSGHHATLLRDTVRALLPDHNVYITDWSDAKHVSLKEGIFSFDHYIDYLLDFIRYLGADLHIIAVCQPAVPVLCAVSLLAEYNEPCQPRTMTLMGGPIDTRINPGQVNQFAQEHSMRWLKENLTTEVPVSYQGRSRQVCPGFLMLTGFMSLNAQRHRDAMTSLFESLVKGDNESAEAHRKFYDEYRAVLDMPADYYLDSIRIAFKEHLLPQGLLTWRGYPIRPEKIKRTALLTVEGELDDISCPGQTLAAHDLCSGLDSSLKKSYLQKGVGHYGIFNGHRWREEIRPQVSQFIQQHHH